MLFNPNSEGLELFKKTISDHRDTMSNELLEALKVAYDATNDELEEKYEEDAIDVEDLHFAMYDFVRGIDKKVTNIFSKVETLLEDVKSDDESYDTLYMNVVEEIEKYEYKEFEYESEIEIEDTTRNQMKKMIDMGYRFNCEMSREIQIEKDAEVTRLKIEQEEKEILENQRQAESSFHEQWKKYNEEFESHLKVYLLQKLDENTFKLMADGINATYSTLSQKVSGKGSRNHKDSIIEYINRYVEFTTV